MQATRQNTRQLSALESETLEWHTRGDAWSIVNYGPGTLWFNYSEGLAAPGANDSTRLQRGFSFTDNVSSPRYMEISLVAEAPLTYCLDTNQRLPGRAVAEIPEAPVDGQAYARRDASWVRAAGTAQAFPGTGWFLMTAGYRTLHFGDQLEIIGLLQRLTGNEIQPGAWVLCGTLPVGVRPALSVQYRLSIGASQAVNQIWHVTLRLQNTGALEVLVPQLTRDLYLNEIWDLTIA
jgi:hypothetical protein